MKPWMVLLVPISGIVIALVYWNMAVWQECRPIHTFWYCARVVSR